MSNFLYDNDIVTKIDVNPETGNQVKLQEFVPRHLPSLADEAWESPEMICAALGLQIGKAVRHTKKSGTEVRDVFFTKVQGDMSPRGNKYPWKRVGVLYSGAKQDAETGEIKRWHSFQLEGEEQNQPASTPAPAPTTPEAPASDGDETPAVAPATAATDAVDSL